MSIQTQLIPQTKSGRQLHAEFDARFETILAEQVRHAHTPHMAALWQRIADSTVGGKRTRPLLVNLGYQVANNGHDPRVLDIGCAFELLHTALVIHDDIIDQDFIRRGHPTLSAHYRDAALAQGKPQATAEHIGHSAALLAGDALIAKALQLMHNACRDLPCAEQIVDIFHTAIQQSAAGELDDVVFSAHLESPNLDDVLRMHRLKTAAYSFVAPLISGALVAGASDQIVTRLTDFANFLGACYQIIDDVLGTFGDAHTTGKPTNSDLREGKITVLIALVENIETAAPIVESWRNGEVSDAAMRALLIAHDIENKARALADECCTQARAALAKLSLRPEVRTTFDHLIEDLLQRNT